MSILPAVLPTRYLLNPSVEGGRPFGPPLDRILNREAHEEAYREISSWPGYEPTPLKHLHGLARTLGLERILVKDEGSRLGLGSFKALGGMYGVLEVLTRRLQKEADGVGVTSRDLLSGRYSNLTGPMTVTCASAGNHGMAVARGARTFGCRAVVFLPGATSTHRVQAIRREGAAIRRVEGSYDDAVVEAARVAKEEGWEVVSDTASPGYEEVPRSIMQGYTVMVREIMEAMAETDPPTHVFLQAGVGGLAAAVCGHLWEAMGPGRPRTIVVEPAEADCLMESALRAGEIPSAGSLSTSMECLACRTPSSLAWPILRTGAHAFLTIPDYAAEETVTLLGRGVSDDPPVETQPSGAAGMAGLIAATFEPSLADPLELGRESRVLIFASEGPPRTQEVP